jgi:hypothetical protein
MLWREMSIYHRPSCVFCGNHVLRWPDRSIEAVHPCCQPRPALNEIDENRPKNHAENAVPTIVGAR